MRFKDLLNESDWRFGLDSLDFGLRPGGAIGAYAPEGLRPPTRRGHRGLRPGGICCIARAAQALERRVALLFFNELSRSTANGASQIG